MLILPFVIRIRLKWMKFRKRKIRRIERQKSNSVLPRLLLMIHTDHLPAPLFRLSAYSFSSARRIQSSMVSFLSLSDSYPMLTSKS